MKNEEREEGAGCSLDGRGAGQVPTRFGGWEVAVTSVQMPPELAEHPGRGEGKEDAP